MRLLPHLVFALAAVPLLSNASEPVLSAGTTITASFESKMAMKWHRIGGPEVLQVNGGLKCNIIASTGLSDDDLADFQDSNTGTGRTIVVTVTPLVLVCDGGKRSMWVAGSILPAKTTVGDQVPEQLEFIVAQPLNF